MVRCRKKKPTYDILFAERLWWTLFDCRVGSWPATVDHTGSFNIVYPGSSRMNLARQDEEEDDETNTEEIQSSVVVPVQSELIVPCPKTIDDICIDLIKSGIVTYTGAKLYDRRPVVAVNLTKLDRSSVEIASGTTVILALAQTLAYFYRIQKSTQRQCNSAPCVFVVGYRKIDVDSAFVTLQSAVLYLKRSVLKSACWRLLFVQFDMGEGKNENTDHCRVQANGLIIPSLTISQLKKRLAVEDVPVEFGGTMEYDRDQWIQFRKVAATVQLEPLMSCCRAAAKNCIQLLQCLKDTQWKIDSKQMWFTPANVVEEHITRLRDILYQIEKVNNMEVMMDSGTSLIQNLKMEFESLNSLPNYRQVKYRSAWVYVCECERDSLTELESLNEELRRVLLPLRLMSGSCLELLQHIVEVHESKANLNTIIDWMNWTKLTVVERFGLARVEEEEAKVLEREFFKFNDQVLALKNENADKARKRAQSIVIDICIPMPDKVRDDLTDHVQRLSKRGDELMETVTKVKTELHQAVLCEEFIRQACKWVLVGFQFANQLTQQFNSSNEPTMRGDQLQLCSTFFEKYPSLAREQIHCLVEQVGRLDCQRLKNQTRIIETKCSEVLRALDILKGQWEKWLKSHVGGEESKREVGEQNFYEEPRALAKAKAKTNPEASGHDDDDDDDDSGDDDPGAMDSRRHSYAGISCLQINPNATLDKTACSTQSLSNALADLCHLESSNTTLQITENMTDRVVSSLSADLLCQKFAAQRARQAKSSSRLNALSFITENWLKGRTRFQKSRFFSSKRRLTRHQSLDNLSSISEEPATTTTETACSTQSLSNALADLCHLESSNTTLQITENMTDRVVSSLSADLLCQKFAAQRARQAKSSSRLNALSFITENWLKGRTRFQKSRFFSSKRRLTRHQSLDNLSSISEEPATTTTGSHDTSVPSIAQYGIFSPCSPGADIDASDSSSTAALASFDSPATSDKRLQSMVADELLQTEQNYVSSLQYVIENYLPELLRNDLPNQLRGQRSIIFGNIEKIYDFHLNEFLPDLRSTLSQPANNLRIGLAIAKCFLKHRTKFGLYAFYNMNKPKSDALMTDYGGAKQFQLCDKLDLSSYLLKPVQRMGKYVLMLEQLIKACSNSEREQLGLLRDAKDMVIFQLRHGNDLLAMDLIRGCDVSLTEQGNLIRQDEFLVLKCKGGTKSCRRIFLFEDLILFAKPRKAKAGSADVFEYKQSIKMTEVGLTETVANAPLAFEIWFRRRTSNSVFIIQAADLAQKQAWTSDIAKLLWNQALTDREMRMEKLSSMGVAKNCFELNSANRIENRTVAFSRDAKLRSTLTGYPSRQDRALIAKRPSSMISVTSSSSSNWSSTSGSLVSSYPPESIPRSSESGICSDLATLDECADQCANLWGAEEDLKAAFCFKTSSPSTPSQSDSPTDSMSSEHGNHDQIHQS
ncbi:Puratrophin-1 [Trichinella patagoniensis]|uniref:Puratrophin-1 n=1 Tax=Trichinella patagoniensis TaxID=990121 RepID=A0A0V0ZZH4_9BILA|nr:Puratrophin-1 [Trichinella patagoniensis]